MMNNKLFFLMIILLLGVVSALEIDNIKQYDEVTRTATIRNSILGIPTTKVADVTLHTPQNYYVMRGLDRMVAEFTIYNYEDKYKEALKDMEFYNNYDKQLKKRNFVYKYKELVRYDNITESYKSCTNSSDERTCATIITGYHLEPVYRWVVFDKTKDLPVGNYTIGIFTDVLPGDNMEWIPTMFGERIEEWASWTDSFNVNLTLYYKLDDTTGSVIDSSNNPANASGTNNGTTRGVTGKINNSFDFENAGSIQNVLVNNGLTFVNTPFTINLWVKPESMGNNDVFLGTRTPGGWFFGIRTAGGFLYFGNYGLTSNDSAYAIPSGSWSMVTVVYNFNATGVIFYINGSRKDNFAGTYVFGANNYQLGSYATTDGTYDGLLDEIGAWNRSLTGDEINNLWNNGDGLTYSNNNAPTIVVNSPANNYYSNNTTIIFNATVYDNAAVNNVSLYLDGVLNDTNTSGINNSAYIFTKTLSEGNHTWFYNAYDNGAMSSNSSSRNLIIDSVKPVINIHSPSGIQNNITKNSNQTINVTITDSNIASCYYSFNNGANTTFGCSTFNVSITTNNNSIIVYANDTTGNLHSNTTSWNYKILENNISYEPTITEGTSTAFNLSITTNGVNLQSAYLHYNGTQYSASTSNNNNTWTITRSISIPDVSATQNFSFYYNLTRSDGFNYITPVRNQTVYIFGIDDCSNYTNVLYNMTIVDEITQTKIIAANTSSEVDIIIYTAGGVAFGNLSQNYTSINPFAVCLSSNLSGSSYIIDAQIKYEANNHAVEYYNIQQDTLNTDDIRTNITLYDLDTTNSQEFQVVYKDENFVPVDDALIIVQRKYISEGVFKTVEIPITDSEGKTLAHLQLSDIIYTFIVVKNGEILATFDNRLAYCDNVATGDCTINLNAVGSGTGISSFVNIDDYSFSIDYDKTTRTITGTFVVTSGTPANNVLNVTLFDGLGNNSICSDSVSSSSGTLTCAVPTAFENSTIIVTLEKDGTLVGRSIILQDNDPAGVLGNNRVFVTLFAILMIIGVGLSNSPVILSIALIIGVVGLAGLSFIGGNTLFGVGATITWFIIAIIIVLIKSRRSE